MTLCVLLSGARHKAAGADCHRNTRHSPGLVHQVQADWPQEDFCVCAGWGWCHDIYTGSSGPEPSHQEVNSDYFKNKRSSLIFFVSSVNKLPSSFVINIFLHSLPLLMQTAVSWLPVAAFLSDLWWRCVEVCREGGSWAQYHQAEAWRGDSGKHQAVLCGLQGEGGQVHSAL